ncbi:cytochrome c oxidase assembly protein [Pigmentiphaga litoralis]|uniref:Putative membrane protein n=1 Tax=Pigmentiphaga litoralis TaxID=516702 RepID=A0A7Y9IWP5_9BURK|nr:cytochrome c oxidase assembly protein [Pigmentiphaga litoralis]NYE22801.1 putative membrane protein [Pigmentiphaga litoralis]NYE83584.1 putative membrane protein [Pigmentiphaga litoralis]
MATDFSSYLPYCGAPAIPVTLWSSWNLDPWLIAGFAIAAAAYWRGGAAGRGAVSSREQAYFYAGWAVALLTLISPLCALSVALFSARVAQHMLLVLVAAPLMVLGRGQVMLQLPRWAHPPVAAKRVVGSGRLACAVFAMALWFWHAPGPYSQTFDSTLTYWAMHASLFAAAVMLWRAMLPRHARSVGAALMVALVTAVQMGLLGALLTFARRPLYVEHWNTAMAWGLSSLDDQQLGGLIMWVPGGTVFIGVAVIAIAAVWRTLGASEATGFRAVR